MSVLDEMKMCRIFNVTVTQWNNLLKLNLKVSDLQKQYWTYCTSCNPVGGWSESESLPRQKYSNNTTLHYMLLTSSSCDIST